MEQYAKLLAVFEQSAKVHSRIKAQKMFYILKSLGYPVSEKLNRLPQLSPVTQTMANVAAELNGYTPKQLELISTIMFLEDQPVRSDLILSMVQSLKPQFTMHEIQEATEIVKSLRASRGAASLLKSLS